MSKAPAQPNTSAAVAFARTPNAAATAAEQKQFTLAQTICDAGMLGNKAFPTPAPVPQAKVNGVSKAGTGGKVKLEGAMHTTATSTTTTTTTTAPKQETGLFTRQQL